jgi:NAD(P)H dehydrogenase (quinone)
MQILVTGATGHLGSAVIQTLLKKISSNQISIITRKEEKQLEFEARGFNAHLGNYDDVIALEKAMQGVDTVLLISSGDQGDRMQEHKNVIDTAVKMGVKNIAYTSRCLSNRNALVNKLMVEHFETEDYIKASGMQYTFFRNILYMDTIPIFVGGKAVLEGGIFLPAGDGKVAFALRKEMGEAMANVLLEPHTSNKIYNFTGNEAYSFYDVASALTDLSSKAVKYTDIEEKVFSEMLKQRNLSEQVIKRSCGFIADIKQNQEATITNDLETKLGREPTNLLDGLRILFGL